MPCRAAPYCEGTQRAEDSRERRYPCTPAGELVDTHSPPWPFSIDSVVEALKGLGFTLGTLARSGYAHLRTVSGVTLATLVVCTLILAPFLCMASAVLAIGLACCVPAVLTGLVVAWLPTALRAAWAVAVALYGWVRAPARTPTLTRAPAPSRTTSCGSCRGGRWTRTTTATCSSGSG